MTTKRKPTAGGSRPTVGEPSSTPPSQQQLREAYAALKPTDKVVLDYLRELRQAQKADRNDGLCTISIPRLAKACNISPRQVQRTGDRLADKGLLKRVDYDLGNADRKKRGTNYKIFI